MYMDYELNKGIGESAEFKGLKAQYLFIFAGGLLALFVLFVILYMAGVGQWLCIAFGVTSASALVWLTFHLNGKFGEHGLMKLLARNSTRRYLINRISPPKLFTIKRRMYAEHTKGRHIGKQVPASRRRSGLYHLQRCGHHRRL